MRTYFEKTISKSINHTKLVYRWQETFKMSVHTAKCRFPINSYKFSFFPRYFYIKKLQLSIFFLAQKKKTCLDDKYWNNHEISKGVQPIRREQKYHQHIFWKKTGSNSLGHCSSHLNKTKLRKSFKGLLNSCKLQIFFKSQRNLSNVFLFKDRLKVSSSI